MRRLAVAALALSPIPLPPVLLATACAVVGIGSGIATAGALPASGHRMRRDGTVGWNMASALVLVFAAALLADTSEALSTVAELKGRPGGP